MDCEPQAVCTEQWTANEDIAVEMNGQVAIDPIEQLEAKIEQLQNQVLAARCELGQVKSQLAGKDRRIEQLTEQLAKWHSGVESREPNGECRVSSPGGEAESQSGPDSPEQSELWQAESTPQPGKRKCILKAAGLEKVPKRQRAQCTSTSETSPSRKGVRQSVRLVEQTLSPTTTTSSTRTTRKSKGTQTPAKPVGRSEEGDQDETQWIGQSFACQFEFCDQTFLTRKLSYIHLDEAHLGNNYCRDCDKQFTSRDKVMSHYTRRHRRGDYPCAANGCDFRAVLRRELVSHQLRLHGDTVRCSYEGCDKWYSSQRRLHKHIAAFHLHERKQVCSWPGCGKAFFEKKHLRAHTRIHMNLKRFRCKWPDCSYASEQDANVLKHIRIRHLRVPFTRKQQLLENVPDELFYKAAHYLDTLPQDVHI